MGGVAAFLPLTAIDSIFAAIPLHAFIWLNGTRPPCSILQTAKMIIALD